LITHVKENLKQLTRRLNKGDIEGCMRLIGNCDTAPTFIQAMCMDLQEECVEALVDMVEHPEDKENTIHYLTTQIARYETGLKDEQKKYHRFMFHEPDHSIFTRLGRVKAEYEPRIMLKNLQYLDMKAAIDSYMTGYKRDRHELHQWLRQVIQTN
jgi:hypothetical protein